MPVEPVRSRQIGKPGRNTTGKTLRRVVVLVLMLAPAVVVLWEMVVRPVLSLQPLPVDKALRETSTGVAFAKSQSDYKDSLNAVTALLREERFWQSRLEAAQKDSLYLTFDSNDSSLMIESKGVVLRRARADRFEMSALLKHMKEIGQPLTGSEHPLPLKLVRATVPQTPVRILDRSAGLDTTVTSPASDPPDSAAALMVVSIIYEIEPGITLYLKQSGTLSRDNWYTEMEQFLRHRWDVAMADVDRILTGESPKTDLWLSIEIPREDVIAIFRALPGTPNLIVRF